MSRYRYNQQVSPPAPFVHVSVRSIVEGTDVVECPAQLDSGADLTIIPSRVVQELGLLKHGEIPTLAFGGHLATLPSYLVIIQIRGLPPRPAKVLASSDEPYVLLGRDILNQFRVTLDGPNLALEIE